MHNELISFIVPVFNTEDYLERCLDSIVAQDYKNTEVIIVNDGSTDGSLTIIENYCERYENFRFINQSNRGVGAARNVGVNEARGDFISFVDSDDLIMPNFCSYLLDIIEDSDIAIAGRENYKDEKYIKSKTAPFVLHVDAIEAIKYLITGKFNSRPVWGKLYRRNIIDKVSFDEKHIFEEVRYSTDTFALSRKVVFADQDLYSYRVRPGSIMTTDEEKRMDNIVAIFKEWAQSKSEIHLDVSRCNRTYTRFTTNKMSSILPNIPGSPSGWNTDNHYFYEIVNRNGKQSYIQLAISSKNITDDFRTICDEINQYYPSKLKKDNWQWRTPFRTKTFDLGENLDKMDIFSKLNSCMDEVLAFELDLSNKMGNNLE